MQHADLILYNANVYTLNKKKPNAQAIAIKNKKITAVGTNKEILRLKTKNTKTINLKGKTVIPGLIDCHVHMSAFAHTLQQINLGNITSITRLQQKLRQAAAKKPPNTWITARGFDHEKFKEKRLPTRFDLDKAVPNHPTIITRVCGHLAVANSKALEIANLTDHKKTEKNAKICKDPKTGEPTGILLEDAQQLVMEHLPDPNEEELLNSYKQACKKATENGLTSIHWILSNPREIQLIQKLREQKKLPIRTYMIIPIENIDKLTETGIHTGFGDYKIKIGSAKIFADGSLGASTAALQSPYADNKTTRGLLVNSKAHLEKLIKKSQKNNFQTAIHAIGDRAIKTVLDALEHAQKENTKKNHRHRIEHASVLNRKLIERIQKLKIIISVQPHFVASDFWIIKRLGNKRARWTYPFRTLLISGICVCAGSDCPVEPINPLLGIWAAVTREISPQERISIDQAIRMYTINAAFASFEEKIKGTIEEGKLADLTILAQDPYKVDPQKIKDIHVTMTIVDGKIVYKRRH